MYQFSKGYRLVVPYMDWCACVIREAWSGMTAEEILRKWIPCLADRDVECAFKTSRVLIGRTPVKSSTVLSSGDRLGHLFHRHEPEVLDNPTEVTHVDENLVVVNKPCSIPVHPVGRYKRNTVVQILKHEHPSLFTGSMPLGCLYRLDRVVSGVLVMSRSTIVASALGKMMMESKVTKEYIARVKGIFPSGRVEVNEPIGILQKNPLVFGICPEGKPAVTLFDREAVISDQGESLVRCWPTTGRQHQIRVHLKALGYPIVNDIKYGGGPSNFSSSGVPQPENFTKMQWCGECQSGMRDTTSVHQDDLMSFSICLHALSYACHDPLNSWKFEVPRPKWAI